jgi:hypothetical protein
MMANVLKMAIIESILSLHAQRWSQRRIARELKVDRETVRKYLRQGLSDSKPAIAPTGSGGSKPATFPGVPAEDSKPATNLPTGSEPDSKPAGLAGVALLGLAGPQSHCEPYREIILAKMEEDLSAKRIWQDLTESGASVGYDSVRRFIQRLGRVRSLPFRRMECGPGEEAQVDFGSGAPVNGELKQVPRMVPDEEERQEVWLIADFRDSRRLSFAEIADQLEVIRAAKENRPEWPRAPYKGSENRRWDQNRVYKAYKARKRVPMPDLSNTLWAPAVGAHSYGVTAHDGNGV